MAGKIRALIDEVIAKNSKGQSTLVYTTRARLVMKGIFPDKYTATSDDDPVIIGKLQEVARELGLDIAI